MQKLPSDVVSQVCPLGQLLTSGEHGAPLSTRGA